VSFLWWTGRESLDPKGHWLWEGSKIGASNCEPGMCAPHQPPIAWSGDHGLWSAVSALQPTETVINCGLWRDCISSPRKANQLANRVAAANISGVVFWKTTTLQKSECLGCCLHHKRTCNSSQSCDYFLEDYQANADRILRAEHNWRIWDAAAALVQFGTCCNASTLYWNAIHPHCIVQTALNRDMLQLF
jgi:hypothetical protein